MSDQIIRHNFDRSLDKLQEFIERTPESPSFQKVETTSFLVFDHNVTGEELNILIEQIQNTVISYNNKFTGIINELKEVYHTFKYLDKEYLNGILASINAAKEASDGAKTASDQAKKAAEKALQNEADIRKELEVLKNIVDKLESLRTELDTQHAQFSKQNGEIESCNSNLTALDNKLKLLANKTEEMDSRLNIQTKDYETFKSESDSLKEELYSTRLAYGTVKNKLNIIGYTSCVIAIMAFILAIVSFFL